MKTLRIFLCLVALIVSSACYSTTYYVNTTGNDSSGDGTAAKPWKTLMYAVSKVPPNLGNVIQVGIGTFIENGLIEVPLGVSITGSGREYTFIKATPSFYYHPSDPGYSTNKFLISLSSYNPTDGNQSLRNFTIDGDSKQLHGGIYVRYRNKVIIDNVRVQNTNFTGIWLWDVRDSKLSNSILYNCSWGSTGFCVGALNLGNVTNVDISHIDINESTGYGIKAIGPNGYDDITNLKIHDGKVSVNPFGLWNNGTAPNIAIELWQVNLINCEIYNMYVDNTISLVNSNAIPSTGVQTIRVHDNTLDMATRANGSGYGIELTVHDAEIDHNYFIKGNYGIANWDNPMKNWTIHHNTFYALQGIYPGEVVRSQWSGLHNVKLYNNTIEFTGDKTMNVVGIYGGISDNIDIKNNLVINSNTSYSYYTNQLIHSENGAVINVLQVLNNSVDKIDPGSIIASITNSLVKINPLLNPSITKTGQRPTPYYLPTLGSSLIDAGLNVGYSFTSTAPDIGAWEATSTPIIPPPVVVAPPPVISSVKLNLYSTDAKLFGKAVLTPDNLAAKGSYFSIPSGNGTNYYIPPPSYALFNFQLPKTDIYIMWVRVRSPLNQGYYIYDGKGRWFNWQAGINSQWRWVKVLSGGVPVTFSFNQGVNEIQFGWNDDNVQIDQILITNDVNLIP